MRPLEKLAWDRFRDTDHNTLREYLAAHPVQSLTNSELGREYQLAYQRRQELQRKNKHPWGLVALKWASTLLVWLGLPLAFASWPIGLPMAIVGVVLHHVGGPLARRYERDAINDQLVIDLINDRVKVTFAEIQRRSGAIG